MKFYFKFSSYPENLAKRAELLYLFAEGHRRHYHLSVPAVTKDRRQIQFQVINWHPFVLSINQCVDLNVIAENK